MTQKQKKPEPKPAKSAKTAEKRKTAPAVSKAAPPRTRGRILSKVPSETDVRLKAYFLWESRGCPIGSPEVDWYRAKEQLSLGIAS